MNVQIFKNWFHVKSDEQKKPAISTLCCIDLFPTHDLREIYFVTWLWPISHLPISDPKARKELNLLHHQLQSSKGQRRLKHHHLRSRHRPRNPNRSLMIPTLMRMCLMSPWNRIKMTIFLIMYRLRKQVLQKITTHTSYNYYTQNSSFWKDSPRRFFLFSK